MNTTPIALLTVLPCAFDQPFGFRLLDGGNRDSDAERNARSILALLDAARAKYRTVPLGEQRKALPERAYVRLSTWYAQRSYSDHSGVIVEPSDPAKAEDRAAAAFLGECLAAAFPLPKTGNYRPSGMVERNAETGRYVYETGCYGIGD